MIKIKPIEPISLSNLNYNQSNQESQYSSKRKYKCPNCNHSMNYDDLIKISEIDEEYEKALIKQKTMELGYEFGIVN